MELDTSRKAAVFFRKTIGQAEIEEFWIAALNPQCQVINAVMLFRGTVDSCFVHPRDVFRFGLQFNASSVLVGHNHPSGQSKPSSADVELTTRLREAGLLLQIPLVDHIIIAKGSYFSFAESSWQDKERILPQPPLR